MRYIKTQAVEALVVALELNESQELNV
eukprot:SAG11_NODE_12651_length_692_cov_1.924115_2_plen_26_part_01